MGAVCAPICGRKSTSAREGTRAEALTAVKTGYTVQMFVSDNLVPVFGLACRNPVGKKQRKQIHKLLIDINQELGDKFREFDATKAKARLSKGSGVANRWLSGTKSIRQESSSRAVEIREVPPEAICNVKLDTATAEGTLQHATFDFYQENRLEVKISGHLVFPPAVTVTNSWFEKVERMIQRRSEQQQLASSSNAEDEKKKEGRMNEGMWFLNVTVWVVLERQQEEKSVKQKGGGDRPTVAEQAEVPLQVKCVHLSVSKEDENNGDSLIDSWLPEQDILENIEMLLSAKLQIAIAGLNDNT